MNDPSLDYMLARYYSSSLGRFMEVDPEDDSVLEAPQSWNRYAYVRNNPLAFLDPSGKDRIEAHNQRMQASLERSAYDRATAARMAMGTGEVDRGVFSNVVLSPELHFGGEAMLNRIVNEAINAYGTGDSELGDDLRRLGGHLATDMGIHEGVGPLKHLGLKIAGFFQQLFTGKNTLDPDSPASKGYRERAAKADANLDRMNADINAGRKRSDNRKESSGTGAHGSQYRAITVYGQTTAGQKKVTVFVDGNYVGP